MKRVETKQERVERKINRRIEAKRRARHRIAEYREAGKDPITYAMNNPKAADF
ncbi:MAG: hypothetical protein WCY93_07775 [Anaerolineaceae bacterium]